jgi:hypothetical protein
MPGGHLNGKDTTTNTQIPSLFLYQPGRKALAPDPVSVRTSTGAP